MSAGTDFSIPKPMSETVEKELCRGGHKIDNKTPLLQDIQLDQRLCDCGRMKYIVEDCGCPSNQTKELHSYPNQL